MLSRLLLVCRLGVWHYLRRCFYRCVHANANKSESALPTFPVRLTGTNIPIASVAAGFPAGQTPLKERLEEIRFAVANGATEIDIVISRTLALNQQWQEMYDEVKAMREACGEAHLKTILATGELGTMTNIYKASLVAMMAGSDFIKVMMIRIGISMYLLSVGDENLIPNQAACCLMI